MSIRLHPRTGEPLRPLGYRRNGTPIWPILGAAHIPDLAELRAQHPDDDDELCRAAEAAADAHKVVLEALHRSAGDRELKADEARAWEAHVDAEGELRQFVEQVRAGRVVESRKRWGGLGIHTAPGAAPDVERMNRHEVRDSALRLLENKRSTEHLRTDQVDQVARLVESRDENTDGAWIAKAMLLTENDAYRSAFRQVMTHDHPLLTSEEVRALRAYQEFRAMSGGTDNAGGYGVPILIDPTIILTGQGSLNPFWDIATVKTITTDEWRGVSSTGVSWSFDAEGSTVSDDSPTLAQPIVTPATARGFVPFSLEVEMDYPDFAGEVMGLMAEGYQELTASHFAVGNISSTNRGIITALDANTNVEVVVTTDGAFGAVDINKVWTALPDRAKGNATWLMSHDVATEVAGFGNGNNLSFVTVDLTGVVQTLRQRPVVFSSYTGDFTGTTGASNLLVVGNFKRFVIAQRAGMAIERVPHLFDVTNNRPTGQRGFFAWARVGSNTTDDLSFRLLQNT